MIDPQITHAQFAAATKKMITECEFQIPNKMARNFVRIEDWLEDIATGRLVVSHPNDTGE